MITDHDWKYYQGHKDCPWKFNPTPGAIYTYPETVYRFVSNNVFKTEQDWDWYIEGLNELDKIAPGIPQGELEVMLNGEEVK
jgi:hypothetical protein